jgi:hypothetical protein
LVCFYERDIKQIAEDNARSFPLAATADPPVTEQLPSTSARRLRSPRAAMVAVSATVVNKTGIIVSFAGGDKKKAQCIGAVMELSASAVITAVSAPTGVLLVLSVASLAASSVNAYNSCF